MLKVINERLERVK
jgi:hypothetical protein